MIHYRRFSEKQLKALKPHERYLHAIIAIIANRGVPTHPLKGFEFTRTFDGGVVVEEAEINIKPEYVVNTTKIRPRGADPLEEAVKDAIESLVIFIEPPKSGDEDREDSAPVEEQLNEFLYLYNPEKYDYFQELIARFVDRSDYYPLRGLFQDY